MRVRTTAVLGMVIGMGLGAGATTNVIRDWGLHREWRVESDPAHPERPARLVEIPWSTPGGGKRTDRDRSLKGAIQQRPAVVRATVRAGTRVTLWRHDQESMVQMAGTALETGSVGKKIRVRAGLGNATLTGIVRGPASVELIPGKGWR